MARWKHHVCIFLRMHSLFVVTIFVNFLVVKSYFDHANHHVLNFSIFDCRREHTSLASTTLYYLWDFKLLTDSKIYMAGEEARYQSRFYCLPLHDKLIPYVVCIRFDISSYCHIWHCGSQNKEMSEQLFLFRIKATQKSEQCIKVLSKLQRLKWFFPLLVYLNMNGGKKWMADYHGRDCFFFLVSFS